MTSCGRGPAPSRLAAVAFGAGALPGELDHRIGTALAVAAGVILDRFHEGLQRGPQGGAAFGVEQAIEPDQAVLRLAKVQIAPLVGPVGLGQRAGGVDPVLEVLGHPGELAGIHRPSRLQQAGFFFTDGGGAHVLGGPSHGGDMLIPQLALREGRLRLGEFLELAGDADPLGGGPARELAAGAEPVDDAERALGVILARLIEVAHPIGEDRLGAVDDPADLNQRIALRGVLDGAEPARQIVERGPDPGDRSPFKPEPWLRQPYVATPEDFRNS